MLAAPFLYFGPKATKAILYLTIKLYPPSAKKTFLQSDVDLMTYIYFLISHHFTTFPK